MLTNDELNYTDYAFAAISGLWLQPDNYGGGRADAVRINYDQATPGMRADIDKWSEDHPRVVRWIEALYESRGGPAT